jgi:hypothetical protein
VRRNKPVAEVEPEQVHIIRTKSLCVVRTPGISVN